MLKFGCDGPSPLQSLSSRQLLPLVAARVEWNAKSPSLDEHIGPTMRPASMHVRSEDSMSHLRHSLLIASVVFLTAVLCFSAYEFVYPPFTDAEIKASLVDTWEAHAVGSVAILILVLLGACLSATLAWGATRLAKRFAVSAVALGLADAVLLIASHVSLTERTTALTGHTFGGFYGLL